MAPKQRMGGSIAKALKKEYGERFTVPSTPGAGQKFRSVPSNDSIREVKRSLVMTYRELQEGC